MHGGDQSDLLGFAPDNQARVEGPDGGDRGHVWNPLRPGLYRAPVAEGIHSHGG